MKYSVVLQHSETDCGAASLAAICRHYGRLFTLNRVREAVGTGQYGTTMLGVRKGAESLGFKVRCVQAAPEILDNLKSAPLPAIIHWKGYHWVVLYGMKGKKYIIADPAMGIRYLSRSELREAWVDWVMILLEPDELRFYSQKSDNIGSNIGRIARLFWSYRGTIIQALIYVQIIGLLSLAYPILVQILTDDVLIRGDRDLLTGVAIAVMTMNIISSGLNLIVSNLVSNFVEKIELGLILEFCRTLLQLPLTYFETRRSGEIISRLGDLQQISNLVLQFVLDLPSQIFISIISLGLMLFYSPFLTLVATAAALAMTLSTVVFLPALQQKIRQVMVLDAENQGFLVETFKGALTFKTTAAAPQIREELQMRFGKLANVSFRTTQFTIYTGTFSGLVSSLSSIAILWFGSTLVFDDRLSIGQLLAFNSMSGNFFGLFSTIIGLADEIARVRTAVQRVNEVIEHTSEGLAEENRPSVKIPDNADIVCQQINFSYPGRVDLLTDFSITIPGGRVTALVGKSGCGKSSLAKLIANLHQIDSGNISIGLYNLADIALDSWRQQVVLVPQDAHFWSRSIMENFTISYPQATFEDIVNACRIVGADEFINNLPNKYQTVLGEFGANLSGGQRQRLALARGIITNPPVLILDESTSGLEPPTEAAILARLLDHRYGKTTILISHKPEVINRADSIAVLDGGKLKLQGSGEDWRSQSGEHLNFWHG